MLISPTLYEATLSACQGVRESEDGGTAADSTDSTSKSSDNEKETEHGGSGDIISDAQKDSVSRYGSAMQTRSDSPKLEGIEDDYNAIRAFLGMSTRHGTQKIVESDSEDGNDAVSDYWKHYDKEGKKYDKRYAAARQEMSNAALGKVLSKAGSSQLPTNVKITSMDEAVVKRKFNPNKAKGSVDDSEDREKDFQASADAARPTSGHYKHLPSQEPKPSTGDDTMQKKADSEHRRHVNNLKVALEDGKISRQEYDKLYQRAVYTHAHGVGIKGGKNLSPEQIRKASDAEVVAIPIITGGPKGYVPSGAPRSRPRIAMGTSVRKVYINRDGKYEELVADNLPSNVRITFMDELKPETRRASGEESRRQIQFGTADSNGLSLSDVGEITKDQYSDREAVKKRNKMRTDAAKVHLCPRNQINWKQQ